MKKILLYIITLILITLFIPYSITMAMSGVIKPEENILKYDIKTSYLSGVAARILVSMDEAALSSEEFIKTVCIVANTLLHDETGRQIEITEDFLSQYYISEDELRLIWADNYDSVINSINNAIDGTKGLMICHNGTPVKPFFHYISNGCTRGASDNMPYEYLKCCDTNEDLLTKGFLTVTTYSETEFVNIINDYLSTPAFDKSDSSPRNSLQITERDDTGYVRKIRAGSTTLSGDEFMQIFSLKSPSFTITFQDDNIKIITKGAGHGYGISLSYALYLCSNDYSYEDTIKYFYQDVEIKNMD